MSLSETLLGGLTPEAFLRDYWQKKPLLVRNAFPDFRTPLTPDDLATLACDEDVAARLVLERGGDDPWELRYGPFEPEDFEALPPTHWTLLVQEVDRHVPGVAALLESFRFVPNWRLDDVMVSYAPPHGGVGAHIDNYDVFLIQAHGRRRWRIHHTPVREENLIPDLDVRILRDFVPDAEWVLEPGDLLYLPPRIAHEGVALDDCMTCSIGFRTPGPADVIAGFLEHLLPALDTQERYGDAGRPPAADPGEIHDGILAYARDVLHAAVDDEPALRRWLGCFLTEPKRGEAMGATVSPAALVAALRAGAVLRRRAVPLMAYLPEAGGAATLFAAGEAHPLAPDRAFAAPLLTGTRRLDAENLAPCLSHPDLVGLLVALVEAGVLAVD